MLIETLSKQSDVSIVTLKWFARNASQRYKVYTIKKKNGGDRIIEHPGKNLKAIQRWISHYLLSRMPIHDSATAYKKGASIQKNAERHRHTNFTLRIDFENFFPSFSDGNISQFLTLQNKRMELGLTRNDIQFVCNIVCRNGKLTIGAPTSPILSNVMMFDFDSNLSKISNEQKLVYTRYADDIFVSSTEPDSLAEIKKLIMQTCGGIPFLNLKINQGKTAFLSRRYKRKVAGLVITPTHEISIGRSRKRLLRTLVFKYINNDLKEKEFDHMRGLLAFSFDAEPNLRKRLENKYGEDIIAKIQAGTYEHPKSVQTQ